jgi:hypothetical protein
MTREWRVGGGRDVGSNASGLRVRGHNCRLRNRNTECAWRQRRRRPWARETVEQVQLRERYALLELSGENCQSGDRLVQRATTDGMGYNVIHAS